MTTETVDLPQICHHGEKQNGECYCAVSQHFQENPQIHTWSNSHQQICKSLQNTNPKILAKYLHGIITQSFTDFFYLHSDCSIELYTVCYLNCLCNILGWFVTRWEWFLIWKWHTCIHSSPPCCSPASVTDSSSWGEQKCKKRRTYQTFPTFSLRNYSSSDKHYSPPFYILYWSIYNMESQHGLVWFSFFVLSFFTSLLYYF